MLNTIGAFLSLLFFLSVGIQAAIVGDFFLALVTALGAWWALSSLIKELL